MTHGSAPSSAAAPPADADYSVLRWLVAATFVVILNETIIINAVPRLQEQFGVSERAAGWLTTAFMLTMAVVIPITGWFLQRVTTRQAFAIAMTVFAAGTLIAAVAPAFWVLLGARIIQASGTAVMMPLLMTTLMNVVPEHDRGRVMGNVTMAISVAPALGPAVSGVILQSLSWRWIFGLVLPLVVVMAAAGMRKLKNVGEPSAGSVDAFSVAVSALGFGTVVYGLSLIGATDQPVSPWVLIPAGVAILGVFVWRQLVLQRSDRPLLDLRAFTHRNFTLSLVLMSVAFMAFLSVLFLLPQYFQNARHLSTLQTGLLLIPGGLAMGLLGPRVGKVYDKFGGRLLVIPGAVGITASLVLFTQIGLTTPYWVILLMHVLMMVSLALVFTPVFTLGLGALPQHLYSHGSSLLGTLQQVAGAAGAAVSVAVLSSRAHALAASGASPESAFAGGMHRAFIVGGGLSLIVVAIALFLPGKVGSPSVGHEAPAPDADELGEEPALV